jgi:hypothetical protein
MFNLPVVWNEGRISNQTRQKPVNQLTKPTPFDQAKQSAIEISKEVKKQYHYRPINQQTKAFQPTDQGTNRPSD